MLPLQTSLVGQRHHCNFHCYWMGPIRAVLFGVLIPLYLSLAQFPCLPKTSIHHPRKDPDTEHPAQNTFRILQGSASSPSCVEEQTKSWTASYLGYCPIYRSLRIIWFWWNPQDQKKAGQKRNLNCQNWSKIAILVHFDRGDHPLFVQISNQSNGYQISTTYQNLFN